MILILQGIQATVYTPVKEINATGIVKDMVLVKSHLYIGTDEGRLQVYDTTKQQFIDEVHLPKIKDFMGDFIETRVESVDAIDGRYLLLSDSGKGGYANLWIVENNVTTQVISAKDKKALVKARFIDKEHILLGYLGNEAALFDIKTKKEKYRVQLSESKFSDFALNEDKSQAVFSCESGILYIINTNTGRVVKELSGVNLDNVYKVDFKNGVVSGAGQDRKGSLYFVKSGKSDFIAGSFLIYATALSPSAKKVAFAVDEQNNISIYDTASKRRLALLKGQKSTLSIIIFSDENRLFSASGDKSIMMWNIK